VTFVTEKGQPAIRDRESAGGDIAGKPVAVRRLQLRAVRALRFAEDLQLHWGSVRPDHHRVTIDGARHVGVRAAGAQHH
jgi:hypothetical protein